MQFRARTFAFVLLIASAASAFSSLIAYQIVRSDGRTPDTFALAVLNTSFWFGWALLSVPLTGLAARWRIDRTPRIAIPINIAGALAAGALHVCLQSAGQAALYARTLTAADWIPSFADRWMMVVPGQLLTLIDWELLAGMGIVALSHAVFYYRETQQSALREANLETRLVEAQLTALQQQLQPHFLFNTLHAISTLMHRDVNVADRVLVRLSDLLRMTLEAGHQKTVPLSRELAFIKSYLEIEQARLGDRLTTEFHVSEDTLHCSVPALILQPLVENAVKHGVARHTRPGRIDIGAERRGTQLVLTVADNGASSEDFDRPGGIGLRNTRARVQHHFGADGQLQLHRRDDGVTAELIFPCQN
jgi:hypothetical protein